LATKLNVISSSTICSTSGATSLSLLAEQYLVSVGDTEDIFSNKISGDLVTVVISWDVRNATAEI